MRLFISLLLVTIACILTIIYLHIEKYKIQDKKYNKMLHNIVVALWFVVLIFLLFSCSINFYYNVVLIILTSVMLAIIAGVLLTYKNSIKMIPLSIKIYAILLLMISIGLVGFIILKSCQYKSSKSQKKIPLEEFLKILT